MNNEKIYLDYNSTAPYSPSVESYVRTDFLIDFANPSSEHDAGFELSGRIKEHRKNIANFLGVSTKSLIFTSGATESINTILSLDNLKLNNIDTIISSRMEHHATLHQLGYLSKFGFHIKFVKNNEQGELDLDDLENILKLSQNSLVSLLYVNNETGVINDVKNIVRISKQNKALVHLDAVQALGKTPFDLEDIDCDYASFSGHKIGSFKGIGLLYSKNISKLAPLLHGGAQERGYRPGTLNYPAIASLALAVKDIDLLNVELLITQRKKFEEDLLRIHSEFSINCQNAKRVYNTINLNVGKFDARALMLKLSRNNIMVSTGSACNGSSQEPSHVIQEIKKSDHINSIRISVKSFELDFSTLFDLLKSEVCN